MTSYVASRFGKFVVERYDPYSVGEKRGVDIVVEFVPSLVTGGARFGFIQVAMGSRKVADRDWERFYTGADRAGRNDFYGDWFVDNGGARSPIFGHFMMDHGPNHILNVSATHAERNRVGHYRFGGRPVSAKLSDEPRRTWRAGDEIKHLFETVVIALDSPAAGSIPRGAVFGAITWGYTVNTLGNVTCRNIRVSETAPFNWRKTCQAWNARERIKIPL